MRDRQSTPRRRTVLAGLGAITLGSALGSARVSAQERGDETFVLEQDDECIPITPLSGDDIVEEFYDWDLAETAYSSHGTKDLQRPNASLLFLYRGPDGDLSLVIVHDRHVVVERTPTSDGGSATFTVAGLPDDGEWLVQDDYYDDPSNYDVWNVDEEPQRIHWTWGPGRTDGGVYGHLGSSFEVTIDPAFNEEADLDEEYYDGEITDWQLLSGDVDDPDRAELALDEPVTIRSGACGDDGTAGDGEVDDDGETAEETEDDSADDDDDGLLGLDVIPDVVNPDSQGLLPVDLDLPDRLSFDDVVTESIQTVPGGAAPERILPVPGGDGDARLFFSVPALDLSGEDSATLEVEAETTEGESLSGESSVPLVPNVGDDDDLEEEAEEALEEAEEEAEEALEEAEEAAEEMEEEAEEAVDDDDDDDDEGPPGQGPDGDGPPGQEPDGEGPPGQGPDGEGPPGQAADDDDDEGGFFDGFEDLFGDDDDDEEDGEDGEDD